MAYPEITEEISSTVASKGGGTPAERAVRVLAADIVMDSYSLFCIFIQYPQNSGHYVEPT